MLLHLLSLIACALLLILAARHARRSPAARTRGSVAGCIAWCVVLLAWLAYNVAGLVRCERTWLAPLATTLIAGVATLTLISPGIRAGRARTVLAIVRPLFIVACVPVALFLAEWPYNPELGSLLANADLRALNLWLFALGLASVWFVAQRRRGAVLAFLVACLIWGLANYFLSLFKGQTVLPADALALSTAAEVSAGYVYFVGDAVVQALCVLLAAAGVLAILPSPRLTRLIVPANLIVGLACIALLVNWYDTHDIHDEYGVTVDVWATRDSYVHYGSIPCFLQRMQEVVPEPPEGYSSAAANRLQSQLAAAWDEDNPSYGQPDTASAPEERPSVIAIMNESFSDLALYAGVEGYDGIEERLASLGAIQRGTAYTSARGGGTCNSEFEYLTGSTLGSVGGGVYPYMFYDMSLAESLPHYFAALGYETTAIHPEAPTNWRRDIVYEQMGFDRFLSRADFPEDAARLRDLVTDRATYDMILDVLSGSDESQFIFDVTLQNHGGYDTGLLDDYPYSNVSVNGTYVEGMSEYLSCIDASLDDLEYLFDELRTLDRPVIVVFFGDHQPGFNDAVAEASTGLAESSMTLSQVQQRFETPYLICANYDVYSSSAENASSLQGKLTVHGSAQGNAGDGTVLDLSLGYLMAQTVQATGLPLTDYQKALLQLETTMPAVNLNGYQSSGGAWFWIGQDGPAADAYNHYATLQYANLFDPAGNTAFDRFKRSAERLSQ